MNLRHPAPKAGALPSCATLRQHRFGAEPLIRYRVGAGKHFLVGLGVFCRDASSGEFVALVEYHKSILPQQQICLPCLTAKSLQHRAGSFAAMLRQVSFSCYSRAFLGQKAVCSGRELPIEADGAMNRIHSHARAAVFAPRPAAIVARGKIFPWHDGKAFGIK